MLMSSAMVSWRLRRVTEICVIPPSWTERERRETKAPLFDPHFEVSALRGGYAGKSRYQAPPVLEPEWNRSVLCRGSCHSV